MDPSLITLINSTCPPPKTFTGSLSFYPRGEQQFETFQYIAMNLQKAKPKYYASIPLVDCILETFFLLLSSPCDDSNSNDETSTLEDLHHGAVASNMLVAAQKHFQQLQHIKTP